MAWCLPPGVERIPATISLAADALEADTILTPILGKELVDYWCMYGSPQDVREQTQLMLDNCVDLVSVFLSNPFTAERDVSDIGTSILARA